MIRKYVFGNPFPTGAVTPVLPAETGNLPFFKKENGSLTLRLEKACPGLRSGRAGARHQQTRLALYKQLH